MDKLKRFEEFNWFKKDKKSDIKKTNYSDSGYYNGKTGNSFGTGPNQEIPDLNQLPGNHNNDDIFGEEIIKPAVDMKEEIKDLVDGINTPELLQQILNYVSNHRESEEEEEYKRSLPPSMK